MATVKTITISHTNAAGEKDSFMAAITVDSQGVFSAPLPEHLSEHAGPAIKQALAGEIKWASTYQTPAKNWRMRSNTLDGLTDALQATLKHYMTVETTEEVVIVYSAQSKVAYRINEDGDIGPNGHFVKDGEWRGKLNGTNHASVYSFGLFARTYIKRTHTRVATAQVEYLIFTPESGHSVPSSWGERLNCFVGLSTPEDGRRRTRFGPEYSEMPYTEEAAKFFYDSMIGLCAMADRANAFFSDRERLQIAIDKGAGLLSFNPSNEADA